MSLRIDDLQYALGPENIEGTPREIRLGRRDLGRLLVVDRATGMRHHSTVRELPSWFRSGDVLVLNNSKRIPGVLKGRTPVGGQIELRFVDLQDNGTGLCRIFPMHDVVEGTALSMGKGRTVRVLELGVTRYGLSRVVSEGPPLRQLLRDEGRAIPGFFYDGHWTTTELNPYYATEEGSVESPLAGLHFTLDLVAALEARGVSVCFVTLHSVGSWLAFLEDRVEDHQMWAESFVVPEATAAAIRRARADGGRVFACGSTSLRALESAAAPGRTVTPTRGRTNLYITPGYQFGVVDAYFTNFHQYQTSLMVLDAAFAGADLAMASYRAAAREQYSFFEFGDAVLYL